MPVLHRKPHKRMDQGLPSLVCGGLQVVCGAHNHFQSPSGPQCLPHAAQGLCARGQYRQVYRMGALAGPESQSPKWHGSWKKRLVAVRKAVGAMLWEGPIAGVSCARRPAAPLLTAVADR